MLDNVVKDVMSRQRERNEQSEPTNLARLQLLDVFLPISVLEKICSDINKVLYARKKRQVDVMELKWIIVLHKLAASYRPSVSTINCRKMLEAFVLLPVAGRTSVLRRLEAMADYPEEDPDDAYRPRRALKGRGFQGGWLGSSQGVWTNRGFGTSLAQTGAFYGRR